MTKKIIKQDRYINYFIYFKNRGEKDMVMQTYFFENNYYWINEKLRDKFRLKKLELTKYDRIILYDKKRIY